MRNYFLLEFNFSKTIKSSTLVTLIRIDLASKISASNADMCNYTKAARKRFGKLQNFFSFLNKFVLQDYGSYDSQTYVTVQHFNTE